MILRRPNDVLPVVTLRREGRALRSPFALCVLVLAAVPSIGCTLAASDGEGTNSLAEAAQKGPSPSAPVVPLPDILWGISAGAHHTCVRRLVSGNVYCWGSNFYGESGNVASTCVGGLSCVKRPTFVMSAKQVELGHDHSCAVDQSGHGLCWGANHVGQLGNGTRTVISNPPASAAPIASGGTAVTFSQISAGYLATCGVTSGTGNVLCWGEISGGPGTTTPTLLSNGYGTVLDRISSVALGGTLACAQWNLTNGLGTDNSCYMTTAATPLAPDYNGGFSGSAKPVAAGFNFYCADQTNGTVQCFGQGAEGQLGDGLSQSSVGNLPVTVGGGMQLHGVTAGEAHACAIDPYGQAYCWGYGAANQLGQMTATVPAASVPSPVAVAAFDANGASVHFISLAAGSGHTCGVSSNGHVYCWGSNDYGELGTGTWQAGATAASQALDPI